MKKCENNIIFKYNVEEDKLIICKNENKKMLLKNLYLKWNNIHNFKTEINTQNNSLQIFKIF
jgi:hypothetical protein